MFSKLGARKGALSPFSKDNLKVSTRSWRPLLHGHPNQCGGIRAHRGKFSEGADSPQQVDSSSVRVSPTEAGNLDGEVGAARVHYAADPGTSDGAHGSPSGGAGIGEEFERGAKELEEAQKRKRLAELEAAAAERAASVAGDSVGVFGVDEETRAAMEAKEREYAEQQKRSEQLSQAQELLAMVEREVKEKEERLRELMWEEEARHAEELERAAELAAREERERKERLEALQREAEDRRRDVERLRDEEERQERMAREKQEREEGEMLKRLEEEKVRLEEQARLEAEQKRLEIEQKMRDEQITAQARRDALRADILRREQENLAKREKRLQRLANIVASKPPTLPQSFQPTRLASAYRSPSLYTYSLPPSPRMLHSPLIISDDVRRAAEAQHKEYQLAEKLAKQVEHEEMLRVERKAAEELAKREAAERWRDQQELAKKIREVEAAERRRSAEAELERRRQSAERKRQAEEERQRTEEAAARKRGADAAAFYMAKQKLGLLGKRSPSPSPIAPRRRPVGIVGPRRGSVTGRGREMEEMKARAINQHYRRTATSRDRVGRAIQAPQSAPMRAVESPVIRLRDRGVGGSYPEGAMMGPRPSPSSVDGRALFDERRGSSEVRRSSSERRSSSSVRSSSPASTSFMVVSGDHIDGYSYDVVQEVTASAIRDVGKTPALAYISGAEAARDEDREGKSAAVQAIVDAAVTLGADAIVKLRLQPPRPVDDTKIEYTASGTAVTLKFESPDRPPYRELPNFSGNPLFNDRQRPSRMQVASAPIVGLATPSTAENSPFPSPAVTPKAAPRGSFEGDETPKSSAVGFPAPSKLFASSEPVLVDLSPRLIPLPIETPREAHLLDSPSLAELESKKPAASRQKRLEGDRNGNPKSKYLGDWTGNEWTEHSPSMSALKSPMLPSSVGCTAKSKSENSHLLIDFEANIDLIAAREKAQATLACWNDLKELEGTA